MASQVTPPGGGSVSFSVPTGNFGDILAGYYAKRMGLPIDQLIVATNKNDILHRFFAHDGDYSLDKSGVAATVTPSMDIGVSSNFERFLFHVRRPANPLPLHPSAAAPPLRRSDCSPPRARALQPLVATVGGRRRCFGDG